MFYRSTTIIIHGLNSLRNTCSIELRSWEEGNHMEENIFLSFNIPFIQAAVWQSALSCFITKSGGHEWVVASSHCSALRLLNLTLSTKISKALSNSLKEIPNLSVQFAFEAFWRYISYRWPHLARSKATSRMSISILFEETTNSSCHPTCSLSTIGHPAFTCPEY